MWKVIHRIKAPSGTAVVTSRYDMAVPVFFSLIQLLSDDPHKAVMKQLLVKLDIVKIHLYSHVY